MFCFTRRLRVPVPRLFSCRHPLRFATRKVLGIETTFDETAAAVVDSNRNVLGEALASSYTKKYSAIFRGVVPNLAAFEQSAWIDKVVDKAMEQSGLRFEDLDAVAVAIGPGLAKCLPVGIRKAASISLENALPLIKVNHVEAHALTCRLQLSRELIPFPFLTLIVSGGHTLLAIAEGVGQYVVLGTSLDDAIGEAYDKVARVIGLNYEVGGGAQLEQYSLHGDPKRFPLSVPMRRRRDCDFSFSGLKTTVMTTIDREVPGYLAKFSANIGSLSERLTLEAIRAEVESGKGKMIEEVEQLMPLNEEPPPPPPLPSGLAHDLAASFQHSALTHIEDRVRRALNYVQKFYPSLRTLVVSGGVASNLVLRHRVRLLCDEMGFYCRFPDPQLCKDNGVMIAWCGIEQLDCDVNVMPVLKSTEEAAAIRYEPKLPLTSSSKEYKRFLPQSEKKGIGITEIRHNTVTLFRGRYEKTKRERKRDQYRKRQEERSVG